MCIVASAGDGSRKFGGLISSVEYILYGHFDLDDETTTFLGNFGHQSPSDAASVASQTDGELKFIIDNTRNRWLPLTVRHTALLTPSCGYTVWSIVAVAERQTGRRCFALFIYESEKHLRSMLAELFTAAMLSRSLCILQWLDATRYLNWTFGVPRLLKCHGLRFCFLLVWINVVGSYCLVKHSDMLFVWINSVTCFLLVGLNVLTCYLLFIKL
jgi:hypothetical protein